MHSLGMLVKAKQRQCGPRTLKCATLRGTHTKTKCIRSSSMPMVIIRATHMRINAFIKIHKIFLYAEFAHTIEKNNNNNNKCTKQIAIFSRLV